MWSLPVTYFVSLSLVVLSYTSSTVNTLATTSFSQSLSQSSSITATPPSSKTRHHQLAAGAIAGISVTATFIFLSSCAAIWFYIYRKRRTLRKRSTLTRFSEPPQFLLACSFSRMHQRLQLSWTRIARPCYTGTALSWETHQPCFQRSDAATVCLPIRITRRKFGQDDESTHHHASAVKFLLMDATFPKPSRFLSFNAKRT